LDAEIAANGGRLDFPVTNERLGGDPIENVPKTLQIGYEVDGESGLVGFNEGSVTDLPRE
jgi:hypothetical protein